MILTVGISGKSKFLFGKLFVTQKLIRNLQCCFLGHKQFPGNQHIQVPSQHCIGGGGGGGSSDCQGMWPLIRLFSHLFKAKQNFLI